MSIDGTINTTETGASPLPDTRTLRSELWLVLWVSVAASALRSLLSLVDSLTVGRPLAQQVTSLVSSYTPDRPWLDFAYQGARICLGLVPVLLVMHLLRRSGESFRAIGFDATAMGKDLLRGMALAAVVGGVGLAVYVTAFNLGLSVRISAVTALDTWWTIPLLLAYAAFNAILEEVILLGYLLHRLEQIGVKPWIAVALSALLRGCYHLYQGFGGFVGNVAMGVLFAVLFRRWGRCMPMVIAHFIIDAVAFVGYLLLAGHISWLP